MTKEHVKKIKVENFENVEKIFVGLQGRKLIAFNPLRNWRNHPLYKISFFVLCLCAWLICFALNDAKKSFLFSTERPVTMKCSQSERFECTYLLDASSDFEGLMAIKSSPNTSVLNTFQKGMKVNRIKELSWIILEICKTIGRFAWNPFCFCTRIAKKYHFEFGFKESN